MEQLIGTYIRERRNELGLPLRKVATHINIDTSTLSKIEKNERVIDRGNENQSRYHRGNW